MRSVRVPSCGRRLGSVVEPCGLISSRGKCALRSQVSSCRSARGIYSDMDIGGSVYTNSTSARSFSTVSTKSGASTDPGFLRDDHSVSEVEKVTSAQRSVLNLDYSSSRDQMVDLRGEYTGISWESTQLCVGILCSKQQERIMIQLSLEMQKHHKYTTKEQMKHWFYSMSSQENTDLVFLYEERNALLCQQVLYACYLLECMDIEQARLLPLSVLVTLAERAKIVCDINSLAKEQFQFAQILQVVANTVIPSIELYLPTVDTSGSSIYEEQCVFDKDGKLRKPRVEILDVKKYEKKSIPVYIQRKQAEMLEILEEGEKERRTALGNYSLGMRDVDFDTKATYEEIVISKLEISAKYDSLELDRLKMYAEKLENKDILSVEEEIARVENLLVLLSTVDEQMFVPRGLSNILSHSIRVLLQSEVDISYIYRLCEVASNLKLSESLDFSWIALGSSQYHRYLVALQTDMYQPDTNVRRAVSAAKQSSAADVERGVNAMCVLHNFTRSPYVDFRVIETQSVGSKHYINHAVHKGMISPRLFPGDYLSSLLLREGDVYSADAGQLGTGMDHGYSIGTFAMIQDTILGVPYQAGHGTTKLAKIEALYPEYESMEEHLQYKQHRDTVENIAFVETGSAEDKLFKMLTQEPLLCGKTFDRVLQMIDHYKIPHVEPKYTPFLHIQDGFTPSSNSSHNKLIQLSSSLYLHSATYLLAEYTFLSNASPSLANTSAYSVNEALYQRLGFRGSQGIINTTSFLAGLLETYKYKAVTFEIVDTLRNVIGVQIQRILQNLPSASLCTVSSPTFAGLLAFHDTGVTRCLVQKLSTMQHETHNSGHHLSFRNRQMVRSNQIVTQMHPDEYGYDMQQHRVVYIPRGLDYDRRQVSSVLQGGQSKKSDSGTSPGLTDICEYDYEAAAQALDTTVDEQHMQAYEDVESFCRKNKGPENTIVEHQPSCGQSCFHYLPKEGEVYPAKVTTRVYKGMSNSHLYNILYALCRHAPVVGIRIPMLISLLPAPIAAATCTILPLLLGFPVQLPTPKYEFVDSIRASTYTNAIRSQSNSIYVQVCHKDQRASLSSLILLYHSLVNAMRYFTQPLSRYSSQLMATSEVLKIPQLAHVQEDGVTNSTIMVDAQLTHSEALIGSRKYDSALQTQLQCFQSQEKYAEVAVPRESVEHVRHARLGLTTLLSKQDQTEIFQINNMLEEQHMQAKEKAKVIGQLIHTCISERERLITQYLQPTAKLMGVPVGKQHHFLGVPVYHTVANSANQDKLGGVRYFTPSPLFLKAYMHCLLEADLFQSAQELVKLIISSELLNPASTQVHTILLEYIRYTAYRLQDVELGVRVWSEVSRLFPSLICAEALLPLMIIALSQKRTALFLRIATLGKVKGVHFDKYTVQVIDQLTKKQALPAELAGILAKMVTKGCFSDSVDGYIRPVDQPPLVPRAKIAHVLQKL